MEEKISVSRLMLPYSLREVEARRAVDKVDEFGVADVPGSENSEERS